MKSAVLTTIKVFLVVGVLALVGYGLIALMVCAYFGVITPCPDWSLVAARAAQTTVIITAVALGIAVALRLWAWRGPSK